MLFSSYHRLFTQHTVYTTVNESFLKSIFLESGVFIDKKPCYLETICFSSNLYA